MKELIELLKQYDTEARECDDTYGELDAARIADVICWIENKPAKAAPHRL